MSQTNHAEEIQHQLNAGYPFLFITTWEEDRVERLAADVAARTRRPWAIWSSTVGFHGPEPDTETSGGAVEDIERALEAVSALDVAVVLMKDLHRFMHERRIIRKMRDIVPRLMQHRTIVIVSAPEMDLPVELEKEVSVLDLPLPTRPRLHDLLRGVLAEMNMELSPEFADRMVYSALGLTERECARVFRKALLRGVKSADDLTIVIEEKKRLLKKSQSLDFYDLDLELANVGGLEELKRWLVQRQDAFSERAAQFGLPPPKGLLLLGVQGCGKSLTSKAVASLWKFPLLRLDLGTTFSPTGRKEESLRYAIKVAESMAPAVLWIDEIEKGFAGAEAGRENMDINSVRAFGSFITWLQEKKSPVFVIATANDISGLPPELLRKGRFDEIFFVDLPNVHEREAIFQVHLTGHGRNPGNFNLKHLAKLSEHFNGAEIEQVVIGGLFRAFTENRELHQRDLERSIEQTVPLYNTYEERIKALREWARQRARWASLDTTRLDFFSQKEA
ncbi:MAG: ATP-dependent zinc metalloprotease FtsH [Myxococcota bacterium]|nr:ATP-dependent zinc metalloprotease FtsH [Myxococcota bacterium]